MIHFRYQPTLEGYLTLNRYAVRRLIPRTLVFIAGVLVVGFLFSPLTSYGQPVKKSIFEAYIAGSGLLILPAILAFMFVATYVGAKRRWRSASELREEVEYEIAESGIRVVASSFNSFIEWQHIAEVDVRSGYYFLQTAQKQFHYFTVSVVPDQEKLVELLTRKVGKIGNLKNA